MSHLFPVPRGWPLSRTMFLSFCLAFFSLIILAEAVIVHGVPFTTIKGLWPRLEDDAFSSLSNLADDRKDDLRRWLVERRGNAKSVAESPLVRKEVAIIFAPASVGENRDDEAAAARKRLQARLNNLLASYPGEFRKIEIADLLTGRVIVATDPGREGLDHSGTTWFASVQNPVMEDVLFMQKEEGEDFSGIFIAHGIRDDSEIAAGARPVAVLILHAGMEHLVSDRLHRGVGRTGEVCLVDQEARLVAPLRYTLADGTMPRPGEFVSKAKAAILAAQGIETVILTQDYRDVPVLAATRHLLVTSEIGWGVVVKMDRSEVLEPIVQILYQSAWIVVAILCLGALVTAFITRGLTRPLTALGRTAMTIEKGDFSVRTLPAGSREMRDMARSFNTMASRIGSWHQDLATEVRKRTEALLIANQVLLENEQILHLAQEAARAGTWDWDMANNTMRWSDELLQLFGLDLKVTVSFELWLRIIHPDDRAQASQRVQEAIANREDLVVEYRIMLPDGIIRWIRTMGRIFYQDNKPVRMTGLCMDITEKKQAEQEQEKLRDQYSQAQKMESVGRLAGGVAHDFNNLLGVILGYTDMALEEVDTSDPLHHSLEEIDKAAKRSAELTRQLLAFARKQAVEPKVMDLNTAVTDMLKILRRLIGEDIALGWIAGPGLWAVKIDPSQLDQILANLCVNARDAITGVGKITIETANATLDGADCANHADPTTGDYVMLAVSDNGCGMSGEIIEKIFDPFFTTKSLGEGTGLGLATVYGIVRQNNGGIKVVSEPGKGTTFTIYLPRFTGKADNDLGAGHGEQERGGGEPVLVVEDSKDLLDMVRQLLTGLGYTVYAANTPDEALQLVADKAKIKLLVTDVIMPEMNGRDLVDRLRTTIPGLKVLYMSGYTANIIAPYGVLEEGTHFIQKPFAKKDMAAKIKAVLAEG